MPTDLGALFGQAFIQSQAQAQHNQLQQVLLSFQAEDRKRKVFDDLINISRTPKGPLRDALLEVHERAYGAISPTFRDLIRRSGEDEADAVVKMLEFAKVKLPPGVSWSALPPDAQSALLGVAAIHLKHQNALEQIEEFGSREPLGGTPAAGQTAALPTVQAQPTPTFGIPPLQPTVQAPQPTAATAPQSDVERQIAVLNRKATLAAAIGNTALATEFRSQIQQLRPAGQHIQRRNPDTGEVQNVLIDPHTGREMANLGMAPRQPEEAARTEMRLRHTALFDPNPDRRQNAQKELDAAADAKVDLARREAKARADAQQELYTPKAIQGAIAWAKNTGTIPPFGFSPAGRTQLYEGINDALQKGFDPALVGALRSELVKVENQRGLIETFMKTADRNLGMAQELSDAVARSSVPLLNKTILKYKLEIAGDTDAARFNTAMTVARSEAVRVLGSATGAGQIHQEFRNEVASVVDTRQTQAQFAAAVQTLRAEMANRLKSYDDMRAQLRKSMREAGGESGVPGGPAVPSEPTPQAPGGRTRTVPTLSPTLRARVQKMKPGQEVQLNEGTFTREQLLGE